MKKIIIKVNPQGNVKIEAEGYSDDECLAATAPYEKALGEVDNRIKKNDLFQSEQQGDQINVGE